MPLGPEITSTAQAPADPIAFFLYAGRDASFVLYEDEGLNTDCERGGFTTIELTRDDAARTLTLGARAGSFPEMLPVRTFRIVLVEPTRPVGYSPSPELPEPDASVTYDGSVQTLSL